MTVQTKSVLLIDLPLYAAGLKNSLFRSGEHFQITAIADNLEQANAAIETQSFDVVILDLDLLDFDYPGFVQKLQTKQPDIHIVCFSEIQHRQQAEKLKLPFFVKPANLLQLHPWHGPGMELLDAMHQRYELPRTVKVMLVDDAALMITVLNQIVSSDTNLEVTVQVNNGQEALEQLKTHQPDVILLDIEMPIMDGLTFLRHARIKSKARVIVLSSVAMEGSAKAAEARRLGADAVIAKPSGAVSLNLEEKSGNAILECIYSVLRA